MGISVRPARLADADEIARLTLQLGYDVEPSGVSARLSRILASPNHRVWLADTGRSIDGWVHAFVAEYIDAAALVVVGGLVVDSRSRGSGVGRLLMATVEAWAREAGCSVVRLTSSATRTHAHGFYERIGYTNIKTQYSFAKLLDGGDADQLKKFVPRVQR